MITSLRIQDLAIIDKIEELEDIEDLKKLRKETFRPLKDILKVLRK